MKRPDLLDKLAIILFVIVVVLWTLLLTGCAINNQPCERGAQSEVRFGDLIIIRTCKEE